MGVVGIAAESRHTLVISHTRDGNRVKARRTPISTVANHA